MYVNSLSLFFASLPQAMEKEVVNESDMDDKSWEKMEGSEPKVTIQLNGTAQKAQQLKELLEKKGFSSEDEGIIYQFILRLISGPDFQQCRDTILSCLALYADKVPIELVPDRLCRQLMTQDKREATTEIIKRILTHISPMRGHFVSNFIPCLVPRLNRVMKADPTQVPRVLELMKLILSNNTTRVLCGEAVLFIGDVFCTGEELGSGTFSIVRKGWWCREGKVEEVAIKELKKTALQPKFMKLIKREIDMMNQLKNGISHPNVLKLYNVVLTRTEPTSEASCIEFKDLSGWAELEAKIAEGYNLNMVLEYVGGGSLKDYLAARLRKEQTKQQGDTRKYHPLSEEEARHYLCGLAAGLRVLRCEDIIHRDLKPANLLLSKPSNDNELGVLKIADFGLGRFLKSDEMAETRGIGSPLYMAPEILRGQKHGVKADLWSVGVITFELLFGHLPYTANTPPELLRRILERPFALPERPKISPEMGNLLKGLLNADSNIRFSWTEFFSHPVIAIDMGASVQVNTTQQPTNNLSAEFVAMLKEKDTLLEKLAELQKAHQQEKLEWQKEKDALTQQNEKMKQDNIALIRHSSSLEKEFKIFKEAAANIVKKKVAEEVAKKKNNYY